jgi:hypothetical protein
MCQKNNVIQRNRWHNPQNPFVPPFVCDVYSEIAMARPARWPAYFAVALIGLAAWAAVNVVNNLQS